MPHGIAIPEHSRVVAGTCAHAQAFAQACHPIRTRDSSPTQGALACHLAQQACFRRLVLGTCCLGVGKHRGQDFV